MANKALDEKALQVLQEPEDLHQSVKIIPMPFWLITALITLVIITLLMWGIFGKVYTEVKGEGIILPEPTQVFVADAQHGGLLERVFVTPGQQVKKGELLAETNQSEVETQINLIQDYIKKLQAQKTQVKSEWDKYDLFTSRYLDRLTKSIQQKKIDASKHKAFLSGLLDSQKNLKNQGIITIQALEDTQVKLFDAMEALRGADEQYANVMLSQQNSKLSWLNEFNDVELKILEQQNKLQHLRQLYRHGREIRSPVAGMVDQILAPVGHVLAAGTDVISIVQEGHKRNLVAFIKPDMGKRIKTGMRAYVSPTTVSRSRYGSIVGDVGSVNEYPASEQAIFSILGDKNLTQRMLHDGGSLIIHIRLKDNAKNVSGFKWTSKGGPPFNVTSGTISRVEVVIETQRPIVLVLPFLKSLVTGER